MGALAIPLQAQAPQPASPLQNIGQIMALGGQMSEIALRREQIKTQQQQQQLVQVEQAQKNRDLADQNTYQEAMKDPAISAKVHTGDFSDLESKIQPKNLDVIRKDQLAYQNSLLTYTKGQNEVRDEGLGQIESTVAGLQYLTGTDGKPDLAAINSALPGAIQHLHSIGAFQNSGVDISKIPSQITDPNQLNQALANIGGLRAAHEKVIALQKTQGDIDKSEGDAAQAQAQTAHLTATLPKDQADAQIARNNADFAAKHGGLTPDQAATTGETARHNKASEAVAGGELGLKAKEFAIKYGGDVVKGWADVLKQNPDAVSEIPPDLKNGVMKEFTSSTGLPFPKPLAAGTQTQEVAARNALDGAAFIEKALENPEIRAQIGPIMGRLGNAEQAIGTAGHLSPEAAQMAQELRTRMRYFVFQEGKAVLGGRLPQKLMDELSQSSASVKMDPDMLKGAVSGAKDNALSILDNADRERFGGQMRTREQRGYGSTGQSAATPALAGAGKSVTKQDVQDYATKHSLSYSAAEAHVKANGFEVH